MKTINKKEHTNYTKNEQIDLIDKNFFSMVEEILNNKLDTQSA